MPVKPRLLYWDACVLLSFLNGDEERGDVIRQHLDMAHKGEVELFTSTVSQVEIAYGSQEQDAGAPISVVLDAIEAFWSPGSSVNLVELHRLIALDARALVRDARLGRDERLMPLDAIHLATAHRMGVTEFHTYDGKLLRLTQSLPFVIREPWLAAPQLPGMQS